MAPVDNALDRLYVMADRAAGKDVRAADLAAITTISKELEQLREERDALQGRVYALENAFPEDVRDEMEKGRYAVQRAKIAEAEAQRLREGLREIEQAASIYAASKHPEKDAEDLFLDVGVKARALLAASP